MPRLLARCRSSFQKRSCCVQLNWSTFRCGRNEHSIPAPQTNCLNGSESTSPVNACGDCPGDCAPDCETWVDCCCPFTGTMRVNSSFQARGLSADHASFACC